MELTLFLGQWAVSWNDQSLQSISVHTPLVELSYQLNQVQMICVEESAHHLALDFSSQSRAA
eukprot:scaffold40209_cov199-Amphora_coffeaeformis.AAC.1